MSNLATNTPKLNSHNSDQDAGIDQIGETLFDAYCVKSKVAQKSNVLADGIAAGHAWACFMRHYEKTPVASAGRQ